MEHYPDLGLSCASHDLRYCRAVYGLLPLGFPHGLEAPAHARGFLLFVVGEIRRSPRRLAPEVLETAERAGGHAKGGAGALHAATWKTAAISNVAVAFRRILGTAALVLPIQIERHWRDNAASTLRVALHRQDRISS
jgi:hypothetical protein